MLSRLAENQKADVQQEKAFAASSHESDVSNEPHLSKAALKMQRYRQRLKDNGLWEDYRGKENEAINKCKSHLSEEKQQKAKEQACIRAQRY